MAIESVIHQHAHAVLKRRRCPQKVVNAVDNYAWQREAHSLIVSSVGGATTEEIVRHTHKSDLIVRRWLHQQSLRGIYVREREGRGFYWRRK